MCAWDFQDIIEHGHEVTNGCIGTLDVKYIHILYDNIYPKGRYFYFSAIPFNGNVLE